MVPRLFTPEQKEIWKNTCADILQNIENDPNFLEDVITCDESWFFYQYDPESKRQLEQPQFTKAKESTAEQIQI